VAVRGERHQYLGAHPAEHQSAADAETLEHFQEKWIPVFRPKMRPQERVELIAPTAERGASFYNSLYSFAAAEWWNSALITTIFDAFNAC
jgi:hypothetical protein